jgi:acyl carrier protein
MIRWFAKRPHAVQPIPAGLTRWGMEMFVEPRVRRLVAEHLGVGLEKLVSRVTLRDDLAADSLDLTELAVVLEGEFAVVVAERVLDEVHTYGDLVTAIALLIRERRDTETRRPPPPRFWMRIMSAAQAGGTLERTAWLTPYIAGTIREDALAAGRGARLEMTVATSSGPTLASVRRQFAPLSMRGIDVTVRRGDGPPSLAVDLASDRTTEEGQAAGRSRAHPGRAFLAAVGIGSLVKRADIPSIS